MTDISDSYIAALTTADTYFGKRLGATAWTSASDADQTKALQMATAAIDSLPFQGFKYLSSQSRQFPRKFYIDPNQDSPWGLTPTIDAYGYYYQSEVPDDVETACMLEALALLEYYSNTDPLDEKALQDVGVKSFSLGKLSMSFGGRSKAASYGLRSNEAYELLEKFIETSSVLV